MRSVGDGLPGVVGPSLGPLSPERLDDNTPASASGLDPASQLRERLFATANELHPSAPPIDARPATWESTIRFIPTHPFAAKPVQGQADSKKTEAQRIVSAFPAVKLTITEERHNHALEVRFSLSGPVEDTREASSRLQELFVSGPRER